MYANGPWIGSAVRATDGSVSSILSSNGCGVYFTSSEETAQSATFDNTVICGCGSHGIHLDAALPYNAKTGSNQVRAVVTHCTIANNGGDGLHMVSLIAGSYGNVTNSIFANNVGQGLNLIGTNGVFTCAEGYNDFFNDDIMTNGGAKAVSTNSSTADPLFYGKGDKPSPWYLIGSRASPAYHRGSDGRNRGAYQSDDYISSGSVIAIY